MAVPESMTNPFASASLPWLVRLRWLTIGGQLAAAVIAKQFLHTEVLWWLVFGLVSLAVASNVWLTFSSRTRAIGEERGTQVMGWILVQDTALLTGILLASSASANPFTVLYLVNIVLAALVLTARWTGWVTLLSAVGFGSLFLVPVPEAMVMHHHGHDHNLGYSEHLVGMWIAFAVTAAIVAYFVRMISVTLESQRSQIGVLREKAATTRHLASLTTLAAGAAHELRTPLATIALAAHELGEKWQRLELPKADIDRSVEDLALIEAEVERCQDILSAMRPGFDEELTSSKATWVHEVLEEAVSESSRPGAVRVELEGTPPNVRVPVAKAHLARAISQLVANAIDACGERGHVSLGARVQKNTVVFSVEDDGTGMDAETREKATTPFFTTKGPGGGMGLGLFLAQAFAVSVGGDLRLSSEPGVGSRVELSIPIDKRSRTSE